MISRAELRVSATMLYGALPHRALDNSPISNLPFPRRFLRVLGTIKREGAEVNRDLGFLEVWPKIQAPSVVPEP